MPIIVVNSTNNNISIQNKFKSEGYEVHSFSRIGKVKELSKLLNTKDNKLMQEIKTISKDYNERLIKDLFKYIDEYNIGKDLFIINISD